METQRKLTIVAMLCAIIAGLSTVTTGRIIYVDDDAASASDGSSWADAFTYLQDALADANDSEKPVEIRVAQGIYKPDQGSSTEPGDRAATFSVVNGTVLRGGYAGNGVVDPNARNVSLYETTLTGDLNGDDPDVQDARALADDPSRADNSFHVVTIKKAHSCVLDGFTIRGGHARGGGGGLQILGSSPTVWNCTFVQNWGPEGGAVFVPRENWETQSGPKIHNCTFRVNSAGDYGGGLCIREGSLLLTDCEFAANAASRSGGGIFSGLTDVTLFGCTFCANGAVSGGALHHANGNLHLTDCTFMENAAVRAESVPYLSSRTYGGAMHVSNGLSVEAVATDCLFQNNRAFSGGAISGTLTALRGCRFTGNVADDRGGVLDVQRTLTCENCLFDGNQALSRVSVVQCFGPLLFTNCTVVDNWSPDGQAFTAVGGHGSPVDVVFTNCIVWGAPHGLVAGHSWLRLASVTWSNVQGGYPGEGNIDIDPRFADPGQWDSNGTLDDPTDDFWVEGDYHLKSRGGRWDPVAQTWVQDEVTSPCIDAGDPNSPVSVEPEPNGDRINMGAYGGTAEASKSYLNKP